MANDLVYEEDLKTKGGVEDQQVERASDKSQEDDVKSDSSIQVLDAGKRAAAERHLIRKLDMRLLPIIILIYIMNYIDRTAITTARLKGLEQDLGLTDLQYETVVAILYASYCPAQIPSNMLLNWISRPSLYIGTCVVLWGLTSALTGVRYGPCTQYWCPCAMLTTISGDPQFRWNYGLPRLHRPS